MSSMVMNKPARKLPSVDGVALIIGVIGLVLNRLPGLNTQIWTGVLGLAVFGPPLLRELGILKDVDEFARNIRWRAGFHTALAVAMFVLLNPILFPLIRSYPDAVWGKTWFFTNGFMRQTMVVVFLLSYLIQYWGPCQGVFRILLGVAGLTLIEVGMVGLPMGYDQLVFILPYLGLIVLLIAMAFLARSKPQWGGWFLVVVGVVIIGVAIIFGTKQSDPDMPRELRLNFVVGIVQVSVHVFLVLVVSGVSVLKSGRAELE